MKQKYRNEEGTPLPHYKDHVSVTKMVLRRGKWSERRMHWCSTIRRAEKWIEARRLRSPKDRAEVESGQYSVNPDGYAVRAYARLKLG